MSIVMQINPFDFFTDIAGDALDAGFIYIGQPNLDPRQYPVTAYYDAALTIPAAMPLRTSNGYIVRNGSPTFLYINGNYSVRVENKTHAFVYYVADFLLTGNNAAVSFTDLANSTDMTLGSGLVARSTVMITDVKQLMSAPRQSYFSYQTVKYHEASLVGETGTVGGGIYYYQPSVAKSLHDGGIYIDPDRLADWPTDWNSEAMKTTWYAPSGAGNGVFVLSNRRRIELEQYGASVSILDNTQAIQKAFDSGTQEVSYVSGVQWATTVTMETFGQIFIGPCPPGQYDTDRKIQFNGIADTYAIQIKAPGCGIRWHDAVGGALRPNFVLFYRDQELIPGNADIDGYVETNIFVNFKECIKFVGRSAWVRDNLFSLHTTGIHLQQFIFTSGTPAYFQTLERGYRGFEITGNRFHGSSGIDIYNLDSGHTNLYGCLINDNNHDTDGNFFTGSLSDSTVSGNQIHRLVSSKLAFELYRCRGVGFTGNKIGGEIGPVVDATFAAAAFRFNTKEAGGISISGGSWSNIAGIPVIHLEPPEALISIDNVTMENVSYNARNGAQSLPMVDIANVSGDGRGTIGYRFINNTIYLQPISGGATYGSLVRFAVRGAANRNIDVYGNTVEAGGTIPDTNLVTPSTTFFNRSAPYSGNGAASQTFVLKTNPTWVIITPITLGAANRLATIMVQKGSGAGADLVELNETSVIVKGAYNTSGVVYSLLSF